MSAHARLATRLLTALALLLGAPLAMAQDRHLDPAGRFAAPLPPGWTPEVIDEVLTLRHDDPPAVLHVLAAEAPDGAAVAAALTEHVDASLDAAFASAPLQATPVGLPSGTWTQRLYRFGDEVVAAISMERDGVTLLVLARATQSAFGAVGNAAVNHVLLGLEVLVGDAGEADDGDPPYAVLDDVRIDAGGHALAGTLTLPASDAPVAGVVLVSGSGAQDRDGSNPALPGYAPSRWLADHLTRAGYAVLRYDERGVGASGGDHETATTADLADDAVAALRTLAARPEVDASRVGVVGHSEGGVIAGRIAALHPNEVAAVVLMASPGLPYAAVVVQQVERVTTASGADAATVAAAVAQQREVVRLVEAGAWDDLEAFVSALLREQLEALPEAQRAQLGDVDAVVASQARAAVDAFRAPWLSYFFSYDPADDLRRVRAPVLALFGALDVQVDVDANRAAIEASLAEAGNDRLEVVVFEGVNHLFQRAASGGPDEYGTLEMAFADGVLDTITRWLDDRLAP